MLCVYSSIEESFIAFVADLWLVVASRWSSIYAILRSKEFLPFHYLEIFLPRYFYHDAESTRHNCLISSLHRSESRYYTSTNLGKKPLNRIPGTIKFFIIDTTLYFTWQKSQFALKGTPDSLLTVHDIWNNVKEVSDILQESSVSRKGGNISRETTLFDNPKREPPKNFQNP